jgi:hypothetical protein
MNSSAKWNRRTFLSNAGLTAAAAVAPRSLYAESIIPLAAGNAPFLAFCHHLVLAPYSQQKPGLRMPFDGHDSPIAAMCCPELSAACTLIQIGTLWLSHYFFCVK